MSFGTLFIVATPIGNLKDITYRAIETLSSVQLILCEDTRISKRILDKYKIVNNMISFNEHNEMKKINYVYDFLKDDNDVALISDSGTPCISDPGYRLVSYLRENIDACKIVSIPGPNAAVSALSISGLPTDSFYFTGFLPKKKGRLKKIKSFLEIDSSIIIYESPFRVNKTIKDLYNILGDRKLFIAREISKIHEESIYTTLYSIINSDTPLKEKGEFVLVLSKPCDTK